MKLCALSLAAFLLFAACDRQLPQTDPESDPVPPAQETTTADGSVSPGADGKRPDDAAQTLQIEIGESTFALILYDNDAARALLEQMPMTLSMQELNGNEKFHNLSQSLPSDSEQVGDIEAGDLMLYGSDCLVLFYKSFPTSYRYTRLGYLEDATGLEQAVGAGDVQVTFRLTEN